MNADDVAAIPMEIAEAWNARDLDRVLGFLTDDVEWKDPAMQSPAKGKIAVESFIQSLLRAFPDFVYTIREPVCVAADCTRCAVPWRISVTHSDCFDPPGFAPTNRRAVFEGVDLLEFRGSQICGIETLFDVIPPAEQLLGISLRPPAGGFREKCVVAVQRLFALVARTAQRSSSRKGSRETPAG
jgi:hypothetical protein